MPTVRVVDEALGLPAAVRYYDEFWAPLPSGSAGAHCYDRFTRVDSAGLDWNARRYVVATGQLILEQYFTGPVPGGELEGHSREWYETGQLREDLTYHKSRVIGVLRTYFPDGNRAVLISPHLPKAPACASIRLAIHWLNAPLTTPSLK